MIGYQPGDELAEVKLLGCPWHGKVQDGAVHLPNSTTLTWPQPDGTMTNDAGLHYHWHRGFTFRQSMPWAEAPVRSEEATADDVANGRQFLTSAILAGARSKAGDAEPYLHSQGIAGWLYAAPDNTVWKMNTMGPWSWSSATALSLNLNPRRFGAFGVPNTLHFYTVTATASAMQQTTPALSTEQGFSSRVVDITPDGSKAILMLYRLYTSALDVEPVGFLLLTLAGTPGVDFAATISVLASRATALGTATDTDGVVAVNKFQGVYTESPEVVDDRTAYPVCGGHVTRTWDLPGVSLDPSESIASNSVIASGQDIRRIEDRIVGYWFDDTETPHPVKLLVNRTFTAEIPAYTITPGNPLIRRSDNSAGSGVCILGSEYVHQVGTYSYSREAETRDRLEWKMEWKDSTISHVDEIMLTHSVNTSGTVLTTTAGDVAAGGVTGGNDLSASGSGGTAWSFAISSDRQAHIGGSAGVLAVLGSLGNIGMGMNKYSNNLYGIVRFDSVANDYEHKAVHPFGTIDSITSPDNSPYGSLNPITGEVEINSSTPVSWT